MNDYIRIKKVNLVLIICVVITIYAFSLVSVNAKAQPDDTHTDFLDLAQYYLDKAVLEKQNSPYLIAFAYYYAYYLTDGVNFYIGTPHFQEVQKRAFSLHDSIVNKLLFADSCNRSFVSFSGLQAPFPMPPDVVLVCGKERTRRGQCKHLSVGVYNTPDDIGITSVEIGSKAKLKVCYYADLKLPCQTFTSSDTNLSNNSYYTSTLGRFYWANNIKSLEVSLK